MTDVEAMLAQAYVMEDGRRVFETEDGTQVFDEFGTEVGKDEIDPLQIDDSNPTWEAFSADLALEAYLNAQRADILEFQEKLDGAREQVAVGGISEVDLAELDADLLEAMPDTVKTHVAGLEVSEPEIATNSVVQTRSVDASATLTFQ